MIVRHFVAVLVYSSLIFLIVFNGCHQKQERITVSKPAPIELVRAFKIHREWDSLYVYNDGHTVTTVNELDSIRYFLVGYRWSPVAGEGEYYGRIVLGIKGGFLNENDLIKRIEQYWHKTNYAKKPDLKGSPVIQTIFEFKDSTDYNTFVK
jgi:hypothetical protein